MKAAEEQFVLVKCTARMEIVAVVFADVVAAVVLEDDRCKAEEGAVNQSCPGILAAVVCTLKTCTLEEEAAEAAKAENWLSDNCLRLR